MRRIARATFLAHVLATTLIFAATSFGVEPTKISIEFERESRLYALGEPATFTVKALGENDALADEGVLTTRVTLDGNELLEVETFDLAKRSQASYSCTLNQPGFVKIFVTIKKPSDEKNALEEVAGAGFKPEKIVQGLPKPDDFDAFWAKGREEVRAIPIDVQKRKLDEFSNDKRDMYAVSFATVDNQRVFGWLGVPKLGKERYPAIVNVAWAGLGFGPDPGTVDEGFAVLTLNVFPYEVPINEKERANKYDEYNKELGCNYFELNAEDRDKYFYRAPILGLDRAVDWFAQQEFVDADRIGYHGTSQGGGFGLILTGLNKNIDRAVVSVPAICDHGGIVQGRNSGWPQLVGSWRYRNNPELKARVQESTRYYDAANFAQSITVPIVVTVGFRDVTCCPSSVYAAFNGIPSTDKQILNGETVTHVTDKNYGPSLAAMKEALKK